MNIFDFFRELRKKSSGGQSSAQVAKERLQIIVHHERGQRNQPDYLPDLQRDLIEVIQRYVKVDVEQVQVMLESKDNQSILELNVTLPDPVATEAGA
ncbi:cell division topological specificity factor [Ventosimonas gracilis]|uniref:Cell division topological specificity factor n=1 Tax=Ventosimonas gracilis TaxID=1680762 RepID=A0A139SV10_9GAMM|nr:cell division topological specificity factor MinE [Ventosimonas gracilis]KXU38290.1 cell division topological specificity factor [Ventosimonas gracilis]